MAPLQKSKATQISDSDDSDNKSSSSDSDDSNENEDGESGSALENTAPSNDTIELSCLGKRIISITLDNASNNDRFIQTALDSNLLSSLESHISNVSPTFLTSRQMKSSKPLRLH
ncbi:hypothetical protein PSTG_08610 [Puccinia striiformis f. sp. tritici PST-78]|uniref:Uncharacterized protein n=1 Tax=Puccinia striiformis f. sp. tritici PST-78 TaxID=1165861 RepID=A0A0L0VFS6_9BASI|nr:hypothetical protein PSTG_08610 [Puccinia striiformis f. sp. tritici PST-78]